MYEASQSEFFFKEQTLKRIVEKQHNNLARRLAGCLFVVIQSYQAYSKDLCISVVEALTPKPGVVCTVVIELGIVETGKGFICDNWLIRFPLGAEARGCHCSCYCYCVPAQLFRDDFAETVTRFRVFPPHHLGLELLCISTVPL